MSLTATPYPDPDGGASFVVMADHLIGPLTAGALHDELTVAPDGRVAMRAVEREPLLVIAPRSDLADVTVTVSVTINPGGAANAVSTPIVFAPYTRARSYLVLHRPVVDSATRLAAPVTLGLSATEAEGDNPATPIALADLGRRFEVRLIRGTLGLLLQIMGSEKARLLRAGREIAAQRALGSARLDALDRIGTDLGVARFIDDIAYDDVRREIVPATRLDAAGVPLPEPDLEYRRRLSLYRPRRLATRGNVLSVLNGPGAGGDPNHGVLSELGVQQRFDIVEADNEFAIALRVVAVGNPALRPNLFRHLRLTRLVLPNNDAQSNAIHAARSLPSSVKQDLDALRNRLRTRFAFPADGALAPHLAKALDRLGQCLGALGVAGLWNIMQSQNDAGGSRYELGLGCDLQLPVDADLDALAARAGDPARPKAADPVVEALLRSLAPATAAADPEATWLLKPCGFATIHALAGKRVYLSNLPVHGLVLSGPSDAPPAVATNYDVVYNAPGDPGPNAVLIVALAGTEKRWIDAGEAAFAVIPGHDADAAHWSAATAFPGVSEPLLQNAGLAAPANFAPLAAALRRLAPDLLATLVLDDAFGQAVLAGDAAAGARLARLIALMRAQGVTAALPLATTTNRLVLVVSVSGLPEVGINLSEARATGFRWYGVPITTGGALAVAPVGSRTRLTPHNAGLFALVCLGYARRGLTDPYEFRVELPAGACLTLKQYEYLMNTLDLLCPLGIEVNTYRLRREHVDLNGDGVAEPLAPSASRTFRRFQRKRSRGEGATTLTNTTI